MTLLAILVRATKAVTTKQIQVARFTAGPSLEDVGTDRSRFCVAIELLEAARGYKIELSINVLVE